MITPAYVLTMAHYNRWQNASLFGAATALGNDARNASRGAFFGSIHGTLCHLMWADEIWIHRFAKTPKPEGGIQESPNLVPDWAMLASRRSAFDQVMTDWANQIDPAWLTDEITWFSAAVGQEMRKPAALLVMHMFNHQTHHRGQVHAMLTAAGAKPEPTDLPLMPD